MTSLDSASTPKETPEHLAGKAFIMGYDRCNEDINDIISEFITSLPLSDPRLYGNCKTTKELADWVIFILDESRAYRRNKVRQQ